MKTALGMLYVVSMMALGTRRGRRSPYWVWRRETAFGHGPAISKGRMLKVLGEYCRWVAHMRRF